MTGKYTINCFQYQEDVRCVCVNDGITSNDEVCADNYNYFWFKLKGKDHSEMWEVYLYGDKLHQGGPTMQEAVEVPQVRFHDRVADDPVGTQVPDWEELQRLREKHENEKK